jgi:hypothetical protein
MKTWLRSKVFTFVRRIVASDDGRDMLLASIRGGVPNVTDIAIPQRVRELQPYADLPTLGGSTVDHDGTIFISGRFRSGSTLLWNIFRHMPDCTAYYEPLNERRWFDRTTRGEHTDSTHKLVEDYWREYDGMGELRDYYCEDWIRRRLFMSKACWDANLKRYLEILIERSAGRAVLQFNRVDFRLPWLRACFPKAKLVHLYRHPRDQWLSSLHGADFPLDGRAAEFSRADSFYLLLWARDLKHVFPFLDEREGMHPYKLFYWIWKLSFLLGRSYAHVSIAFEDLVHSPQRTLEHLFDELQIPCADFGSLLKLIVAPRVGRWREYAADDWFKRQEIECEQVLADFLSRCNSEATPANPVSEAYLACRDQCVPPW